MKQYFAYILIALTISSTQQEMFAQLPSWHILPNSPIPHTERFEDVYFVNSLTGWVIDYAGKIYKTTDGGYNWNTQFTSPLFPNAYFRSLGFTNALTGWIGTLDSTRQLYGTTNGGLNWTLITTYSGFTTKGVCGISVVNDSVIYACGKWDGKPTVIKTTNRGISWAGIDMRPYCYCLIDCRFTSKDSGIVVGCSPGGSSILFTSNGGINWITRISDSPGWGWKISFPTLDTGYVSIQRFLNPRFYKTTDGGNTWVSKVFLSSNYDEQGIGFVNGTTGWIGGKTGPTYETTNGGDNWYQVSWGYQLNRIRFLSDTLGFAAGSRVYKYTLELIGIQTISTEIPNQFSLEQNYPNPFNPKTVIRCMLPVAGMVTLRIFDVLGRKIEILVNEQLNAGTYEVGWSGDKFSSGVYYYQLIAGDFKETKRMVLLK